MKNKSKGNTRQKQTKSETFFLNDLLLFLLLNLGLVASAHANDGAYYTSGNQLIPIQETSISIQKEVLTLKKISEYRVQVTVEYEFYNPGEAKELTVGFEAASPSGDVSMVKPVKGKHPHMFDFTVIMNDSNLSYQVAYVTNKSYAKTGVIKSKKLGSIKKALEENTYYNFFYVYHFQAKFSPGINKITHTYSYSMANSVDTDYSIDYILTAANRWANKQIDDFTLIIDMGNHTNFSVKNSFFQNKSEWLIQGEGKIVALKPKDNFANVYCTEFRIKNGKAVFKKTNFKPKGELEIFKTKKW